MAERCERSERPKRLKDEWVQQPAKLPIQRNPKASLQDRRAVSGQRDPSTSPATAIATSGAHKVIS